MEEEPSSTNLLTQILKSLAHDDINYFTFVIITLLFDSIILVTPLSFILWLYIICIGILDYENVLCSRVNAPYITAQLAMTLHSMLSL